jgi:hypothetical protein
MEQRTIAEVAKSAQVFSKTAEAARALRRERLERFARLLEAHNGPVQMLTQIEYLRRAERMLLRRDGSPLTIAYNDPVFRAQGLASDRLGDAMTFFALDDRQAHHLFCDCHYRTGVSSQVIATQVRAVAQRPTAGEVWRKVRGAISRLWTR